ncbi:MAG: cupin domain-containing protein [Anaerolineales bacterium]|jgi:mannose-6-phosphate isomerase-like protein (cupin superfamily)
MPNKKNYLVAQMEAIPPIACACGFTRRAFTDDGDQLASLHLLDVQEDARVHYHKNITEIYFILEGEGHMEVDGDTVPVKPMTGVLLKPGCRHRAVGELRVAIIAIPAFDPEDEWFDE